MSRNRTSTARKALSGTLRADRLHVSHVEPLSRLPAAPKHLSADAVSAWKSFGARAIELGTLSRFDVGLLELLSRTWASVGQLEDRLQADGLILESGDTRKAHPALAALSRERSLAHKLLSDFGLAPSGRERLSIPAPKEAYNEFDAF